MIKLEVRNILRSVGFLTGIILFKYLLLDNLSAGSSGPATGHTDFDIEMPAGYLETSYEVSGAGLNIYNNIITMLLSSFIPGLYNKENNSWEYPEEDLSLPMILPVPGEVRISSAFGVRRDPINDQHAFHRGIDIPLIIGTPVRATGTGYVSKTGFDRLLGKYIVITHQHEYQSIYGHLSDIIVDEGQEVESGEIIGNSGNTGRSTNPHLHYQVNYRGRPTDPVKLKKELNNLRMILRN
jgi:murein DD-endopeptidase MepM/ murein hydrolase activator NlpD